MISCQSLHMMTRWERMSNSRYKKGDKVYILETMGKKTICEIISSSGGFSTIRLPSGGAIRLRDSRIFPYVDENEETKNKEVTNTIPSIRDPHIYMDTTSKYGP